LFAIAAQRLACVRNLDACSGRGENRLGNGWACSMATTCVNSLDALRENMGVIFQDFARYNLSAANNIAVGRIAARDDRARIKRAAAAIAGSVSVL
jgi:ABC-type polar amino acid transport system ATPase subunit